MYWDVSRWDPFEGLRTLRQEMDRLAEGAEATSALSRFPALNVWGNADKVVVTAELPGLQVDDLDVSVVENQLVIKGERKSDKPAEDATCHRAERGTGGFVRAVRLPFAVEGEKVVAKYEDGVLTIEMPRQEATKPKRIDVRTA